MLPSTLRGSVAVQTIASAVVGRLGETAAWLLQASENQLWIKYESPRASLQMEHKHIKRLNLWELLRPAECNGE